MKSVDVIILGAGIAGASSAFALSQKGLKVVVLEREKVCAGDSQAAGAFISPKMSKPSPYKTYLNDAFSYSTRFYKQHFPSLFSQCGLLKLPLDRTDTIRLASYEPFMSVAWQKREEGYFFPEAGLISPQALVDAMLVGIEVREGIATQDITYHDDCWQVDDFQSTHLIIATGSSKLSFDLPYLRRKKVGGYRYDVRYSKMYKLRHNLHRELSFSHYHDEKVIIGASYIREDIDLQEAAYHDRAGVLARAKTMQSIEDVTILNHYSGYRASTFDYFPIVGKVIHHDKTLEAYPYIQKGAKVPSQKYHYFPNLYIHNALSSRGFVFAPYNAMLLADLIVSGKEIDERLSPVRLFKKWARQGV